MLLFPKCYLENVTKVSKELLQENQIKGLILDIDNTLIDFNKKMLDGVEEWANTMKDSGIKMCIVSNTNQVEKVKKVASTIKIPYIYFATKPLKRGLRKAQAILDLKPEEIAVVGDQILTDIIGANRCHMYAILVKPIAERDIFITRIKRPIEKWILKKYEENIKGRVK